MNKSVTQLRWPEGLNEAVKAAALENDRSMNAEIVARLKASFAPETKQEGRAA